MSKPVLPTVITPLGAAVLVVEDEPLLQHRLQRIFHNLGFLAQNIQVAASISEAHALLDSRSFSMAFVDLALPDGEGEKLIAHMHRVHPAICTLVASAWRSSAAVLGALRSGASGYLHKERDDAEVQEVVSCALRGGAMIDPMMAREILRDDSSGVGAAATTYRLDVIDLALLSLTAEGCSHREVCRRLAFDRQGMEQRVRRMYLKLHA
ncbi:response regulator transcription factor [Diaphorobacter caeni]|uniref:response regulator transcription factor n=1 Tax=Diaphorobacter caeni TaxID=2784387 RepID=UPI00188E6882|nr:response regulator [Diaphorobacter caeni]MBF5006404.1 response regulator transcription factor [Diaphorobacter caeni]